MQGFRTVSDREVAWTAVTKTHISKCGWLLVCLLILNYQSACRFCTVLESVGYCRDWRRGEYFALAAAAMWPKSHGVSPYAFVNSAHAVHHLWSPQSLTAIMHNNVIKSVLRFCRGRLLQYNKTWQEEIRFQEHANFSCTSRFALHGRTRLFNDKQTLHLFSFELKSVNLSENASLKYVKMCDHQIHHCDVYKL